MLKLALEKYFIDIKGKNLMIKPSFQNKINTTHYYNIFCFLYILQF